MTENCVLLVDGAAIPSRTLVWTAGTVPNPLILPLSCGKERGRIRVNEFLRVPDWPDVWAVGDCAFVPDIRIRGNLIRQLRNIHSRRRGCGAEYRGYAVGVIASSHFRLDNWASGLNRSSHGRGAHIRLQFSRGSSRGWMWRTVYLSKLPGLDKKVRWHLTGRWDLLFPQGRLRGI